MDDIYTVYSRIHRNGEVYRRLMGRFLKTGNHIIILEDHGISDLIPSGAMEPHIERRIARLSYNPTIEVVRDSDNMVDMDKVKTMDFGAPPPPAAPPKPPVFDFFMQGMDRPHLVEFKDEGAYLDGQALSPEELEHMLTKVKMGEATISYKDHVINPDLVKSMADQLEESVDPGPKTYDKKTIEEDSMVEGISNRYAYDQWSQQSHEGAFIMMDVNDLSKINKEIEPESGNNVIKAVGEALKEAYGKVKSETSFLARITGDKFMAFFDDHKTAMSFAYDLQSKIDEIAPVNGTHKVSMGFGFGLSQPQAQQALDKAKERKYGIIVRKPDGSIDKTGSYNAHQDGAPNLNFSYLPGASNPPQASVDDDIVVDQKFDDNSWPDNDSPPWSDEDEKGE